MQEQIKNLRVHIDGLAQLTKELNRVFIIDTAKLPENPKISEMIEHFKRNKVECISHTRELENAYDSLKLSKAWLGKCLGELGEQTPYKSGYKTVEDIEPTDDKSETIWFEVNENWNNKSHIEKVDWLREEINKVIEIVKNIYVSNYQVSREFNIARTNCYTHLCEARFALGFELKRIKENNHE